MSVVDSPEVTAAIERVRNHRRDAMLAAAYIALGLILYVIIFQQEKLTEYVQGVVTMVTGALVSFLTMMHNFEYGTTRSSTAKDTAIADMSKTAANTANTAQTIANTAAAVAGAVTPSGDTSVKVENLTVNTPPADKV